LVPCGIQFQTIVPVQVPETYYAHTVDGLSVAYQTVGDGLPDVVLLRGWHTNVEHDWEERVLAHVFRRIASFGRLILVDRRGTGLSDQTADGKAAGIAVVVAARVMAQAVASQTLITSTVKDLVAGSGLNFTGAGAHKLKGFPGTWPLYAVVD
jgi:class 3 adenylate cyclase